MYIEQRLYGPFPSAIEIKGAMGQLVPVDHRLVDELVGQQYSNALKADRNAYNSIGRSLKQLAMDNESYSRLSGYGELTALEIIDGVPKGGRILDVGSGDGTFVFEMRERLKAKRVKVLGLNAKVWEKSVVEPDVVMSIDSINPKALKEKDRFDLVTCSTTLYHLQDWWGGILRLASLVKPNGVLLTSTLPRPYNLLNVSSLLVDEATDTSDGFFREGAFHGWYYRNKNIFSSEGELMPIGEVLGVLNEENQGYDFQCSLSPSQDDVVQIIGRQLSAQRLDDTGLDFSSLYYSAYTTTSYGPAKKNISYVLARSKKEKEELSSLGFINVQQRFDKKASRIPRIFQDNPFR